MDGAITDKSDAQELIALLGDAFTAQAKQHSIRAAVICFDVRVVHPTTKQKTDAVAAYLQHENGEAAQVYLPYSKRFLRGHAYGEVFAVGAENTIFLESISNQKDI